MNTPAGFVDGIKNCTPNSVTALKLRLSVPCLDKLIEAIGPRAILNIKRIGLDLGAWIQIYPIRHTFGELSDGQIASEVMHATRKAYHKLYKEERRKVLPASSCWLVPESRRDSELAAQPSLSGSVDKVDEADVDKAKPVFEHEFYRDEGGSDPYDGLSKAGPNGLKECTNTDGLHHKATMEYLAETKVNTLSTMLVELYDASQVDKVKLYSLEPEWQAKNTNPIHPFDLIQKDPHTPQGSVPLQRGKWFAEPLQSQLKEVYGGLNETFRWRPVFDWDWFVKPDPEDLDAAYANLKQQYGLETGGGKHRDDVVMAEIAKQFHDMRENGIPLHVLLGRRNPNGSSLYWKLQR
jgi:hypothetical protein